MGDMMSRLIGYMILFVLLAHPLSARADDAESAAGVSLTNIAIGIGGTFQVGRWTSIEADVTSDSWPVTMSVWVPDPDGHMTRQPMAPVEKSASGPTRLRGVFKTGRLNGDIRVDIETPDGVTSLPLRAAAEDGEAATHGAPLTQQTRIWATLGDQVGFEQAVSRIREREKGTYPSMALVGLDDSSELPTTPDALESLAVLAVIGSQPIDRDVNEAIRRWVRSGGHLVVSMANREEYRSSPFSDWLPVRVTGQSRLRDLGGLSTQLPGSSPIRVNSVAALRYEFDHGEVISSTLDGPLWSRMPYGFGRVTLLGLDISRRPLIDWEALPQLCERLSDYQRPVEKKRRSAGGAQLSQTGVSDLQTQLAKGLDQFPEIDKPSNWLAMGAILLYLLAIGPLDYLIVHKLLKRPHWTWVTFPLLVVLGAGIALNAAQQRNPTQSIAHQVDLVDVDLASGVARLKSWHSFTSPETARYHIETNVASTAPNDWVNALSDHRTRLSWTGLPETGFRGMYRSGGLDLAKTSYTFAPAQTAIMDLPVSIWSSASSTAEWSWEMADPQTVVSAELQSIAAQLNGTIRNQLSVPMEDWLIAHGGRVYVPQTRQLGAEALKIAPGETLPIGRGGRVIPRVLKSYMTGLRRIKVKRTTTGTKDLGDTFDSSRDSYDSLQRAPYATLRIASFFAAADGHDFTKLKNSSLSDLDLSPLLPLDRAVLFCRVKGPIAAFSVNGETLPLSESETILRIVIPVDKRAPDPSETTRSRFKRD